MKTDREKAIEEADELLMQLPLAGMILLAFVMVLVGTPFKAFLAGALLLLFFLRWLV